MKPWAWIVGGVGAAAGAWWYLTRRPTAPEEPSYPFEFSPDNAVESPAGPAITELEQAFGAPSTGQGGESYVNTPTFIPANESSEKKFATSEDTSHALGEGNGGSSETQPGFTPPKIEIPKVDTPKPKSPVAAMPRTAYNPITSGGPTEMVPSGNDSIGPQVGVGDPVTPKVSTPKLKTSPLSSFLVQAQAKNIPSTAQSVAVVRPSTPAQTAVPATVTTYKSPVTSTTRTMIMPKMPSSSSVPAKTTAVSSARAPLPVTRTPLTKPLSVLRTTAMKGIYAVGADFTEAEYRAMSARAELEGKRREWAANQLAERIAALAFER